MHDTVGIIYQNVRSNVSDAREPEIETVNAPPAKRRRTLDVISTELISYSKKPKLIENLLLLIANYVLLMILIIVFFKLYVI